MCNLDPLPAPALTWLDPTEFTHLALHTDARHDHRMLLYDKWVASVRHSMLLAPECLEGLVQELPIRLENAFTKACAELSSPHPKLYVAEKKEVLLGLALQITNLALWGPSAPPISSVLLNMQPITSANVNNIQNARLSLRHGLEALDCVSFITSIFLSVGYLQTPPSQPESPISWLPYTIPPSDLENKVERTSVPELALRAMKFRECQGLFNFLPSVSDPDAKAPGSSVTYWTSCAGLGGRGITSHLSSLILKLVSCHALHEEQV